MRLVRAIALLVVFAFGSISASASNWDTVFTMEGRNGRLETPGPMHADVAFELLLPGKPELEILVQDDEALVVVLDHTGANSGDPGLWQVNLTSGSAEKRFSISQDIWRALLIPGMVITLEDCQVQATDLYGDHLWSYQPDFTGFVCSNVDIPPIADFDYSLNGTTNLHEIFLIDETLYVTIRSDSSYAVVALTMDGKEKWEWSRQLAVANDPTDPSESSVSVAKSPVTWWVDYSTLTVENDRVFVLLASRFTGYPFSDEEAGIGDTGAYYYVTELWALNSTGQAQWQRSTEPRLLTYLNGAENPVAGRDTVLGAPVAEDGKVFARFNGMHAINAADGEDLWSNDAGNGDVQKTSGSASIGIANDIVYYTTGQTIYASPTDDSKFLWQHTTDEAGFYYGFLPIMTHGGVGYVQTLHLTGAGLGYGLESFWLENGTKIFNWARPPAGGEFFASGGMAILDGRAIITGADGRFTLIGPSDAAPSFPPLPEHIAAVHGGEVELDISGGSNPFATNSKYRIDWGDGSATAWSADGKFSHVYAAGNYTAILQAGNELGHSNRMAIPVNVAPAPAAPTEQVQPTLWEFVTARENYDLTFGVLGVFLAILGATAAFALAWWRSTALRRELRRLDHGFQTIPDDLRWRKFSNERRQIIAKKHRRRRFTDSQYAILIKQIEDLNKRRRQDTITDGFGELPHRLATTLQKILSDGIVTPAEQEMAHLAIEAEPSLSADLRLKIARQVDAWAERHSPS